MSIILLRSGAAPGPAVGGGGAPDWFANQTDGTWMAIADGTGSGATGGNKLTTSGVAASPSPSVTYSTNPAGADPGQPWSWSNNFATSMTNSWTSACFDQDNGEYILCANGGHADYAGNEAYALAVRVATPYWRRLTTPTPGSTIDALGELLASGDNGKFPDGRSRAMHNCFQVCGDGRVWIPYQNSLTSADGGGNKQIASWNRASLGAASSPADYASSDVWAFHGWPAQITYDPGTLKFGSACYDKVGKRVWAAGGEGYGNTPYWYVSTTGGTLGNNFGYQTGQANFGNIYGMACAHNLSPRLIFGYCSISEKFGYIDTSNESAGWVVPTNISGTKPTFAVLGLYSTTQQNMSVQYDAASYSFVFADPSRYGRTLYRLQVPHTGGTFNPSGTWTWTSVTPSGPTLAYLASGNLLCYQKVQLVEDMGNGQSALIYLGDATQPAYCYKIPAGGLNF